MTTQERKALIERYKDGFRAVQEALAGATESELNARPKPGAWSAREIVHHLADSESTAALRLRVLLTSESPVIQGYDQDAFATRLAYQERPIEDALEVFRLARKTTASLFDGMTDADWQRSGTHTESGHYSAERWLQIYATHAHNHADQIRRARKSLS
jgi:hypothetical protein